MATKNDFTAEEWAHLRDTPHLIAGAVMLAGRSGLIGGFQEALAGGREIYRIAESGTHLFKALTTPEETKAAQKRLRDIVSITQADMAPAQLREAALRGIADAVRALETHGLRDEAMQYRRWCEDIAEAVAKAAREGGFLGFGGEQVSEEERRLLTDLRAVTAASSI